MEARSCIRKTSKPEALTQRGYVAGLAAQIVTGRQVKTSRKAGVVTLNRRYQGAIRGVMGLAVLLRPVHSCCVVRE